MKPKPKSVCLLCMSGLTNKDHQVVDHFCKSITSPKRGTPVTIQTSCSSKVLLDRKFPLRGKLAILAQGLANWLGGKYD